MVGRVLRVLLVVAASLAFSSPAIADEGRTLTSENVVRLDPERPAVRIESTYRLTNTTPDRQLGGGRFEYYYFDDLIVPLLPGATEVAVQVNGRDAEFTVENDDGFEYLDIDLGYELRYRRTATVVVRAVLLGDEPRDEDSWIRVNDAYASFEVWGWGDDGEVDVRIEVPTGWIPEWVGDDLERGTETGLQVFTATDIADPIDWGVLFTARNDDVLVSSRVTVGDADFEIRSWPGDDAWLQFANEQIADGVPLLEQLLGTPWPVDRTVEVIEASTPYLSGYAGFYDARNDVIEIGEDLDRHVFLHELSHAWINGTTFDDRWIIEGLAEEFAARAVEQLGDDLPLPLTDDELRDEGAEFDPYPLSSWTRTSHDEGDEDYGYTASFRAMRTFGDEVGDDAMAELLRAALANERAYPGEDGPDLRVGVVDWRSFLDLAEQLTGTTDLQDVYRELVLTRSEISELERRNELVGAYDALLERSGTWHPPVAVRTPLAGWRLGLAEDAIADAEVTLDRRDALWDELAPLGLTSPAAVEQAYQDAEGDLADVRVELDELIEGAERLVDARGDLTSVLSSIGQEVPELTQAEYEDDPSAVLGSTRELVADAEELVATSRELSSVLREHALAVPPLDGTAFVADPDGAQRLLEDRLRAATAVDGVHDRRDESTSPFARVGLIRSDVDADLARLDALLADGDTDGAEQLAAQVASDIDDLGAIGVRRVVVVATALGIVILVIAALTTVRRRRSTSEAVDAGAGTEADGERVAPTPIDDGDGALPPPVASDRAESDHVVADPDADQADAGEARQVDPPG